MQQCAASPESAAALHFAKAALWTVIDSKQLGNLDREGSLCAVCANLGRWSIHEKRLTAADIALKHFETE